MIKIAPSILSADFAFLADEMLWTATLCLTLLLVLLL